MQQLTRAFALTVAAVIAHVSAALPHPAHVPQVPPSPPPAPAGQSDPVIDSLRVEEEQLRFTTIEPAAPAQPPVAPQRQVAPAPVRYSGSIKALIQQAFAPLGAAAVTWAERVAMCESGDNPNARNASGASGLFQIMPGTWAGTPFASLSPFDAVANARAAEWIYARRGGSAWSCG